MASLKRLAAACDPAMCRTKRDLIDDLTCLLLARVFQNHYIVYLCLSSHLLYKDIKILKFDNNMSLLVQTFNVVAEAHGRCTSSQCWDWEMSKSGT